MLDVRILGLMAYAALVLIAVMALLSARGARSEVARARGQAEAARREAEQARGEALVARSEGAGHAHRVAERDARMAEVAADVAALRVSHRDAESRCGDAEGRCAKATEAVARLEADVARLREVQADHARLRADHAALQADADGRLTSAAREVAALKEIRAEMTREFQALAHQTLKETGTQFSATHAEKLGELLNPFKEQVGRFEVELREVHKSAGVDRAVLHEQIRSLTTQTQAVSQEAVNLTRALKGEKHRQGAWGEAQLERYLEHMGYQKGIDYVTQSTRSDDAGDRLRPDVILKMPGGRALVIDSKVSLVSYAAAIAAETEEERARHLRDHVRAVKSRIDELASKGYQNLQEGAVDWVLLFMPIEGAVSAAWAHEADIGTYAMERRIGIAYPTTLLMALRTVKHLWDVENRNANADKIAQRGGLLYDKLASFIESFGVMTRALDNAKAAQLKALGQLSEGKGNLMSQVEGLKKLGAKTGKSLALAFDADPDGAEPDASGADDGLAAVPTFEGPRALPAAE